MIGQVFDGYGSERAEADVQCDFGLYDPSCLTFLHQAFGEMQTGGRSGNGSGMAGVNRLITLPIARSRRLTIKVWRQWECAKLRE